jgi:hypothetical protein
MKFWTITRNDLKITYKDKMFFCLDSCFPLWGGKSSAGTQAGH